MGRSGQWALEWGLLVWRKGLMGVSSDTAIMGLPLLARQGRWVMAHDGGNDADGAADAEGRGGVGNAGGVGFRRGGQHA